jgi:hypothetical protein
MAYVIGESCVGVLDRSTGADTPPAAALPLRKTADPGH